MEITTTTINRNNGRRAAVNALAIVGFIALIIMGIALAIYSARFMPSVASRLGGAAVSLSSVFRGSDDAELEVVTATTTESFISFDETPASPSEEKPVVTPAKPGTPKPTGTYTVTTVVPPVAPHGDPDLTVRITAVGYLRTSGKTETFVESKSVPSGKNGAVQFTVTNAGTNNSGSWKFEVDVPTSPAQNFTSPNQRSLGPADKMDFTLGFTKGRKGDDRNIVVEVDSKKTVDESSESNNRDSAEIDIRN